MARIRSVKPEFWTADQIMEISRDARLLFIGLWNFCDDAGIHPASEKTLKAEVFPGDDLTSADVRRMVDELQANDLLIEYEIERKTYWQVTGWHHQKIDQPTFKHPTPTGGIPEGAARRRSEKLKESTEAHNNSANTSRTFAEHSPNTSRTFAECSPPEGKGKEGKGSKPPISPIGEISPRKQKSSKVTFAAFLADIKATGSKAISGYRPVFEHAESVGLPVEWIELAWLKFRERYTSDPEYTGKRYIDWRRVFLNAVTDNWLKVWYFSDGKPVLSTIGQQAQLAQKAAA